MSTCEKINLQDACRGADPGFQSLLAKVRELESTDGIAISSLCIVQNLNSLPPTVSNDQEKMNGNPNSLARSREIPNDSKIGTIAMVDEDIGPAMPLRSKGKTTLIMMALCLAVFLAALDSTIITTALPTIAAEFKATEVGYTWVGSSYLLASAATTPCWGKISDIFGRKPLILLANIVFLVASLVCALSVDLQMLIAGRVLQGIGAGGLITLPTICISDMFSVRERGLYFTFTGLMWALAGSIGPVIGGAFTQYANWRWSFGVNVPIVGMTLIALLIFLDVHNPRTPLRAGLAAIDWLGIALVLGGTCMFLVGLNLGGVTYPWSSATVYCLILFGIVTLVAFVVVERNFAKFPIIPPVVFRGQSNIAAVAIAFIHGFVYIANTFFLPQYFQIVLGASPLISGVYLLPYILTLGIVGSLAGYYIKLTGRYLPMIYIGMTLLAFGQGLYIDLPSYTSWARIVVFQLLVGLGTGPIFRAILIALHTGVEPCDTAAATSTYDFARNMGTSISVIIGGVIFQNRIAAHQMLLATVLPSSVLAQLGGAGAGGSLDLVKSLSAEQQLVVKTVYTESLRSVWIFYVCIAAVGLASCFFLKKKVLNPTHMEHKTGLTGEQRNIKRDLWIGSGADLEAGKLGVIVTTEKEWDSHGRYLGSPRASLR